ncbi:MAG: hypothetical protein H0W66_11300 [Chthoniobacterales bacterium]|nr:hypothetical protein [Chthoniobacterales bacterium]
MEVLTWRRRERGRVLLDVMDQERFISAQDNGQPVADDFDIAVDFEHCATPKVGRTLAHS